MIRSAVAAALVLALFVMAPLARGAPPWSSPLGVGSPAFSIGPAWAVFDSSGRGLLVWSTLQTDLIQPSTAAIGHLAAWPFGALPVERRTLEAIVAPPQAVGAGRFVVLRERVLRPGPAPLSLRRVRLGVSTATVAGGLGRFRTVVSFASADTQAIAVSARGEIGVAWMQRYGRFGERRRLRLRVGRVGGAFGSSRVLADLGEVEHGGLTDVAVAWGRGGELVIAYPRRRVVRRRTVRTIELRVGRPDGRLRRETLGPHAGIAEIEAASSPRGRVVVAWGSQDGGEEANLPFEVRAAIREPGRRRFGAAQLLDPGGGRDRPIGRLAVAIAREGTAVAAWSAVRGDRWPYMHPVLAATAPAGAAFAAAEQLDPDGTVGGLAVRADARAMVTWTSPLGGRRVLAALREPTALRFAPAEQISPADGASAPSAAFNPRTGEPAVVWVDRPGFQEGFRPVPPAVLYAAVRARNPWARRPSGAGAPARVTEVPIERSFLL